MFSLQRGETQSASQAKILLRTEAKREWPFLQTNELTPVRSEYQLAELVRKHTGRTEQEAASNVRNWMERHHLRPDIGTGFLARRPVGGD